jgi:MFS family permease
MPFVWSIGTIFGPAIAGLTANSSLFPSMPYLLPNLICAGLLLVSIVIGYFLLEETRQVEHTEEGIEDPNKAETESLFAVAATTLNEGADLRADSYGTFNRVDIRKDVEWKVNADGSSRPPSLAPSEQPERVYTKRVVMLVVSLGIYCFHSMCYDDLMPIFAQDERAGHVAAVSDGFKGRLFGAAGGLGLSTHEVGIIMSVNGIIALFIQGVIFPVLAGWLGVWHLFQIVAYLFPVAYFVVPFLVFLPDDAVVAGIYACFTLRNLFSILAYPLILILIKEATSKKHLGKINGLAASAGAAARCLAPPLIGFVYSIGYRIDFVGLAWWVSGVTAIVGAAQVFTMRPNKRKRSTISAPFSSAQHQDVVHISVADVEQMDE